MAAVRRHSLTPLTLTTTTTQECLQIAVGRRPLAAVCLPNDRFNEAVVYAVQVASPSR
jgi:hypothetical protein